MPLFDRFPALRAIPRATLGTFPSPVECVVLPAGGSIWVKREDRNATVAAGNKVRALEFLLGAVRPGDLVLAKGGLGSTHVYATAVHAARLGAGTAAVRWDHEMHPAAERIAASAARACRVIRSTRWTGPAILWDLVWRAGLDPRVRPAPGGRRHVLPIGGSSPLGILGHVNAGLELGLQIAAGELPDPTHVVVPLGTGGTAAGLAIGLGLAGSAATVVAARVAPRPVANATHVSLLIHRTRRLLRRAGRAAGPLPAAPVVVDHAVFGGAYGRPLAAGNRAAALLGDATRPGERLALDGTYAAKAGAAALARVGGARRVVLWATFDARPLPESDQPCPPATESLPEPVHHAG